MVSEGERWTLQAAREKAGPVKISFRELAPRPNLGCRGCSEASGLAESVRAVRALPGESRSAPAKVSISGGGLVNRTAQGQSFDDGFGSQRKIFADECSEFFFSN